MCIQVLAAVVQLDYSLAASRQMQAAESSRLGVALVVVVLDCLLVAYFALMITYLFLLIQVQKNSVFLIVGCFVRNLKRIAGQPHLMAAVALGYSAIKLGHVFIE